MTTAAKNAMPDPNKEITVARILDMPMFNRNMLNLLRANACVEIATKVAMDLANSRILKTNVKILEMQVDIKNSLTTAQSLGNAFIQSMIWCDNTYDFNASQMRRSYEQIRDGLACISDTLKTGLNLSISVSQASCEFKAGVVNYFMANGYTDYMAIESAVIEFNGKYEGSRI